jgi:hypothetical protein
MKWGRCVLHVLCASVSTCRAFSDLLSSCQIAVGFRASIEAGDLEALLRHLSSGESPTQSFVCIDNRVFAHACPVSCAFDMFFPTRLSVDAHPGKLFASHSESHDLFREIAGHRSILRATTAEKDAQGLYLGEART